MHVARLIAIGFVPFTFAACTASAPNPELASDPFPADRHLVDSLDAAGEPIGRPISANIQVFRDGQTIEIVNATAQDYEDIRIWINQRFVRAIGDLRAGETRKLSLFGFFDERGEELEPGGFFRTTDPTPIWLVQLEPQQGPLVGLLTIRSEGR